MDEDRNFICDGCGRNTPVVYNVKDLMFCPTCKAAAERGQESAEPEAKDQFEEIDL